MEEIAKTVYEQLVKVGVKCDKPHYFRGIIGFIKIGKKGLMSIEEKRNSNFNYCLTYASRRYVKKIDEIMKNLGIERFVLPDINFC